MNAQARWFLAPGFLVLLSAATLLAQAPTPVPPGLDDHVARVMKEFQVPGISLAVVKDSKVLAERGYGVRKLGDPTPVDAQTLFGIASNTKAFTATALGLLVEEGKLECATSHGSSSRTPLSRAR
jgi:CubicO group peptidase (beta-lactamase class C family)